MCNCVLVDITIVDVDYCNFDGLTEISKCINSCSILIRVNAIFF